MRGNDSKIYLAKEAFEKEDYLKTSSFIKECINNLKSLLNDSRFVELEKEIEEATVVFSRTVKKKNQTNDISFLFGRYIGFMDAITEYLSIVMRENDFRESINSCDIAEIPHVNDIIVTIFHNEGIRHGKLADAVGIEKSTLTGIMDRLIEKGVVSFSRPGKYKYYYLTSQGQKYYTDNKNVIDAETNVDSIIEQLLVALSDKDDVNGEVLRIIQALCIGKNKFEGYKSKTSEKAKACEIFARIPQIESLQVAFSNTNIHTVSDGIVLRCNDKTAVQLIDEHISNSNACNINATDFYSVLKMHALVANKKIS